MSLLRTRWAAIGAAVAITLGAGGIGIATATVNSGTRTVFVPITPCRVIDTRPDFQVGPKSSPVGPGEILTVTAHGTNGMCTIPNDAVGLGLNITAVDATLPTFLTVWATGVARPNASSLNPAPGQPPTPNAVTTDLGGGQFDLFNRQGSVHVIVDVNGYYANHNHDDRYYKKSEVDDMVETGPVGATVLARGTVFGNVVPSFSSTYVIDGAELTVTRDSAGIHIIDLTGMDLQNQATMVITAADFGLPRTQHSCMLGSVGLPHGDWEAIVYCYDGSTLDDTSYQFLIIGEPG